VLSDVAILMVLVLVVYLVLQFLVTFQERFINEELVRRQETVRSLLYDRIDDPTTLAVDSVAPGRQRLTFQSELLFPECGSILTSEGRKLLAQVGDALNSLSEYFEAVQVDGHTDIVPIGSCRYASNWELSSQRAISVVHLFEESEVIPSEKLSATGWGEFHPINPDSLHLNRRIELQLLYSREDIGARVNARANASSR
jgi:flagellar motor protein MotB